LHSHFVWLRLSSSSIDEVSSRVFGGSRLEASSMDPLKCQTSTATPAEPGGLSLTLVSLTYRNGIEVAGLACVHRFGVRSQDPGMGATLWSSSCSEPDHADCFQAAALERRFGGDQKSSQ
jgi:hypothetical protein